MTFTQLAAIVHSSGDSVRICTDSRQVGQGDVFVAIKGSNVDGHDYIAQAETNGAAYIVSQKNCQMSRAQLIIVDDTSQALGQLAQSWYGRPSEHITNLAVTGTNGKTTVSYLVKSIIETAGNKCGIIGTISYDTSRSTKAAPLTTPDAIEIARLGSEMVEEGVGYVIMEASSHALDQGRLAGVPFTAAAFTNLTGDHLDYHKTEEQYLAAKKKLFTSLPVHATAILNKQCEASKQIGSEISCRKLWYAIDEPADISAEIESMDMDGSVFFIVFNSVKYKVKSPLIGIHNVSNQLAAAGLCLASGFSLSSIAEGLSMMKSVPGRLEKVDCGQDFRVFVDYAHTDDALKNILTTVKPLCKNRLIVVFGCGGDRDKSKRPRMAKVAQQYSDLTIITSDNPRTENPDEIIKDIVKGLSDTGSSETTVEPDREKAIEQAIKGASKNDIIVIAGKGHEDYQIIGTEKIFFDDRLVAWKFLKKRK